MREDLLREVFRDLEEQQRMDEETGNRRRAEVRQNAPEVQNLLDEREKLLQDGLHALVRGDGTQTDLRERMNTANTRIREALRKNGYPENYLEPVYACPVCRDTGYVGEPIREKCDCVRKRYQAKLRREIGLPEDGSETFENFRPEVFPDEKMEGGGPFTQRQFMNEIRANCEAWANDYPNQLRRDLVLSGKSGLGKTFLMHAMASRLIDRGVQVLLLSAYRFLEIARNSYFENDGNLREVIETEVLMLDDLGSEPLMQNVTVEQLYNLINERQRRNLPTVISTNLNREELRGRYTERIASRLTDARNCDFLQLRGTDIRHRGERDA